MTSAARRVTPRRCSTMRIVASASNGLQLKTSRWKRLCSGKVCTLMWLSAMITIPVIPQSSGTAPW
jgi:hypothetical protein